MNWKINTEHKKSTNKAIRCNEQSRNIFLPKTNVVNNNTMAVDLFGLQSHVSSICSFVRAWANLGSEHLGLKRIRSKDMQKDHAKGFKGDSKDHL